MREPAEEQQEEEKQESSRQSATEKISMLTSLTRTAKNKRDVEYRLCVAIFYVYMDVLGAPEKFSWRGPNGACRQIMGLLELPEKQRAIVTHVLEMARKKAVMGVVYAGERAEVKEFSNFMISSGSQDMQIIADSIESGFGLLLTRELLNEHRLQKNLEVVGLNTVWMAYLQLKPVLTPVKKRKQGSNDPNSPWAMARLEHVTQILVRFGAMPSTDKIKSADGSIPSKVDAAKLTKVSINQVAFWDETHKKVRVGQVTANGLDYQVRFHRDENGKIDKNGTCIAKAGSQLKMKYAEEVRLCLGVVKLKLEDGTTVGRRLPLFDYSGKVILSIKDDSKKIEEEIDRVRNCRAMGGWIESNHIAGQLWESESINLIKGVGPKKAAMLAEKGIVSIGDLKQYNNSNSLA